jgi:hypothetical protein
MARELIDGFESGDLGLCSGQDPGAKVKTPVPTGMYGNYCCDLSTLGWYIKYNLVAADEKYFAFKIYPTSTSHVRMLTIYKGATVLMSLRRNVTSGKVELYIGSTLTATGTAVLSASVTYLIELRYKIADAGGVAQVKVQGILDIDYSGDTKPGADTQMDSMTIGSVSTSYCYAYVDDIIVDTAAWIGDTRIQGVFPEGAGSVTEWTPSTGANWECVNEVPPDDADYVSLNAIDLSDLYTMQNLAGAIASIKCVQIQARAVKEGAPTPQNLKLLCRTHDITYPSAAKAVPATIPKQLYNIWETNPNTTNPWTVQEVSDMEAGFKSAA